MSDPVKSIALAFIKAYAVSNQFFTGGDVLAAFRKANLPGSDLDWRNKWAVLISQGGRKEWYVKAGRVKPTSKQSHTGSLVQWHSRLYKGEQSLVGVTAKDQIAKVRKDFVTRKIDLNTALWRAYELGSESNT